MMGLVSTMAEEMQYFRSKLSGREQESCCKMPDADLIHIVPQFMGGSKEDLIDVSDGESESDDDDLSEASDSESDNDDLSEDSESDDEEDSDEEDSNEGTFNIISLCEKYIQSIKTVDADIKVKILSKINNIYNETIKIEK